MRERRGHFAHGGQPGNMDELRLQFLQARFRALALGEIADESCEERFVTRVHFADRELERKRGAALALPNDDPANADDPFFACAVVAFEVSIMLPPVRLRHEHFDVLADDLYGAVTEQALGGRAERLDGTGFVDHDHRIGNGGKDRPQMCFPGEHGLSDEYFRSARLELAFAQPSHAYSDCG